MSIKYFIQKHAIACTIGAVLLGAGAVVVGSQVINRFNTGNITTVPQPISVEQVKKIVEDHTGVQGLSFQYLELIRNNEYPRPHYEIDAQKDGIIYELDVDSVSGKVLSYATINKNKGFEPAVPYSSSSNNTSTDILSEDKVKEIAAKATGKQDLNFAYIRLETDDGYRIYDVKATSGNIKYDLDINATTGEILQSEQETISNTGSWHSEAKISEEQVKTIVSQTTGKSNLNFTEIRLSKEMDDYAGALIYEVTAYADGIEYELDIDATSGKILSSSAEKDNGWFD